MSRKGFQSLNFDEGFSLVYDERFTLLRYGNYWKLTSSSGSTLEVSANIAEKESLDPVAADEIVGKSLAVDVEVGNMQAMFCTNGRFPIFRKKAGVLKNVFEVHSTTPTGPPNPYPFVTITVTGHQTIYTNDCVEIGRLVKLKGGTVWRKIGMASTNCTGRIGLRKIDLSATSRINNFNAEVEDVAASVDINYFRLATNTFDYRRWGENAFVTTAKDLDMYRNDVSTLLLENHEMLAAAMAYGNTKWHNLWARRSEWRPGHRETNRREQVTLRSTIDAVHRMTRADGYILKLIAAIEPHWSRNKLVNFLLRGFVFFYFADASNEIIREDERARSEWHGQDTSIVEPNNPCAGEYYQWSKKWTVRNDLEDPSYISIPDPGREKRGPEDPRTTEFRNCLDEVVFESVADRNGDASSIDRITDAMRIMTLWSWHNRQYRGCVGPCGKVRNPGRHMLSVRRRCGLCTSDAAVRPCIVVVGGGPYIVRAGITPERLFDLLYGKVCNMTALGFLHPGGPWPREGEQFLNFLHRRPFASIRLTRQPTGEVSATTGQMRGLNQMEYTAAHADKFHDKYFRAEIDAILVSTYVAARIGSTDENFNIIPKIDEITWLEVKCCTDLRCNADSTDQLDYEMDHDGMDAQVVSSFSHICMRKKLMFDICTRKMLVDMTSGLGRPRNRENSRNWRTGNVPWAVESRLTPHDDENSTGRLTWPKSPGGTRINTLQSNITDLELSSLTRWTLLLFKWSEDPLDGTLFIPSLSAVAPEFGAIKLPTVYSVPGADPLDVTSEMLLACYRMRVPRHRLHILSPGGDPFVAVEGDQKTRFIIGVLNPEENPPIPGYYTGWNNANWKCTQEFVKVRYRDGCELPPNLPDISLYTIAEVAQRNANAADVARERQVPFSSQRRNMLYNMEERWNFRVRNSSHTHHSMLYPRFILTQFPDYLSDLGAGAFLICGTRAFDSEYAETIYASYMTGSAISAKAERTDEALMDQMVEQRATDASHYCPSDDDEASVVRDHIVKVALDDVRGGQWLSCAFFLGLTTHRFNADGTDGSDYCSWTLTSHLLGEFKAMMSSTCAVGYRVGDGCFYVTFECDDINLVCQLLTGAEFQAFDCSWRLEARPNIEDRIAVYAPLIDAIWMRCATFSISGLITGETEAYCGRLGYFPSWLMSDDRGVQTRAKLDRHRKEVTRVTNLFIDAFGCIVEGDTSPYALPETALSTYDRRQLSHLSARLAWGGAAAGGVINLRQATVQGRVVGGVFDIIHGGKFCSVGFFGSTVETGDPFTRTLHVKISRKLGLARPPRGISCPPISWDRRHLCMSEDLLVNVRVISIKVEPTIVDEPNCLWNAHIYGKVIVEFLRCRLGCSIHGATDPWDAVEKMKLWRPVIVVGKEEGT